MIRYEGEIEDTLEAFPELIDPRLNAKDYIIERQFSLGKNRIDLLIQNNTTQESYIIEIKKTELRKSDYLQIQTYYFLLRKKFPELKFYGYLIGKRNRKEIKVDGRSFKWLKIKYLDEQIPSKIRICKSCKKPIDYYSFECNICFTRK